MSKDSRLIASLKAYVSHKTSINVNDSVAKAIGVIEQANVDCAAVLSGNAVIGLIDRASLLGSKDSAETIKNLVTDDVLRVCINKSVPEILDCALQRPERMGERYLIAVNRQDELVGLVPLSALLKLQKCYFQQEMDRAKKTISDKDILIEQQESDLGLLDHELTQQKEMFTKLGTSRTEFIKQYSHEAHTPMNGVLGMLELLSHTKLSKDQAEMLHSAESSALSMLRLIKSVLDYNQIETGNFVDVAKTFDPEKLLKTVVDSARYEAKQKDLELICNIDLPKLRLRGDVERLGRVLENLILQLLDRVMSGGVVLSAKVRRGSDKLELEINLRSQGSGDIELPGLDSSEIGSMASDDSQDIGSLSTTIAQRVITQLGGVMKKVEDLSDDFGYQINVPFPSVDPVNPADLAESSQKSSRSGKQKFSPKEPDSEHLTQVLIVDDNRINLEVAQRLLASFDCSTYLAKDGLEALEMLKRIDIDCIFLDCEMPRMSGPEVCQKIREGACGADKADVLICAMTAHVLDSSRERCYEVGMNEFIPKPVSKKAFKEVLDKWSLE